jgi:hypothetical protein
MKAWMRTDVEGIEQEAEEHARGGAYKRWRAAGLQKRALRSRASGVLSPRRPVPALFPRLKDQEALGFSEANTQGPW